MHHEQGQGHNNSAGGCVGHQRAFAFLQTIVFTLVAFFDVFSVPYFLAFHPDEQPSLTLSCINYGSDCLFLGAWISKMVVERCRRKLSTDIEAVAPSKVVPVRASLKPEPKKITPNAQLQGQNSKVLHPSKSQYHVPVEHSTWLKVLVGIAMFPYDILLLVPSIAATMYPTTATRAPRILMAIPLLTACVNFQVTLIVFLIHGILRIFITTHCCPNICQVLAIPSLLRAKFV